MTKYFIDWSKAPEGCNMVYISDYSNWVGGEPHHDFHWEKLVQNGDICEWMNNEWSFWGYDDGETMTNRVKRTEEDDTDVTKDSTTLVSTEVENVHKDDSERHEYRVGYKAGDVVTVVANNSSHGFKIGENVKLTIPMSKYWRAKSLIVENLAEYAIVERDFKPYVEPSTPWVAPDIITADCEITVDILIKGNRFSITRDEAHSLYKSLINIFKREIR